MFKKFCKDECGATAIEYGLIAAFMAVSMLAILLTLRGQYQEMFAFIEVGFASSL